MLILSGYDRGVRDAGAVLHVESLPLEQSESGTDGHGERHSGGHLPAALLGAAAALQGCGPGPLRHGHHDLSFIHAGTANCM